MALGGADVIIAETRSTVNVRSLNHPQTTPSPQDHGEIIFMKQVPGCQKGWDPGLSPHWVVGDNRPRELTLASVTASTP